MRLISFFAGRESEEALVAGVIHGDWAVDLTVAAGEDDAEWGDTDLDIGELLHYDLVDLDEFADLAERAVESAQAGRTRAGLPFAYPLSAVELGPPIPQPSSLRHFSAFEQHVKAARARRGLEMVPEWYEFPVFFFGNHNSVFGPDDPIARPNASRELDFELEVACVIGEAGIDIPAADAEHHILGFTIMNDWSARDLQRKEMKAHLGPAKGKDFATSLGPWVTTLDELADRALGDGRWDLELLARVNGREVSRGNLKDITFTFAQMIERASADVVLWPGDVLGSGTVGTGCILELGPENVPWLEVGDVVELEVERLGVLRNTIMPVEEL